MNKEHEIKLMEIYQRSTVLFAELDEIRECLPFSQDLEDAHYALLDSCTALRNFLEVPTEATRILKERSQKAL